ncbi:MAG TPA: class I SAM-dependent methyltransferase [Acidobacteriaceae bacterium]
MQLNAIERMMVNNPFRRFVQRRYEAPRLLAITGRLDGKRALEIGCGQGFGMKIILDQFGAASVQGIDLDPRMVARAQKRLRRFASRAEVSVGDATAIAAEDESFDAVFDFGVLHHVEIWEDAVREVARVLKPGGLFVFGEVSKEALDTWIYRALFKHPEENRFTVDDFVAALERHGIVVDDTVRNFWSGDFFSGVGRRTKRIRLSDDEAVAKITGTFTVRPR